MGRHWIKWMDASRRYSVDTGVPAWRQQPVTNAVYAIYRTLAAKLTKQKPTMEVVPPSGDSDDREAALLGQAILVHLWRLLKTPAVIRRAIGWYLTTGQVFLRVHYDPEQGKRVPLTRLVEIPHPDDPTQQVNTPCPCDDQGEPIMKDGPPDNSGHPYDLGAQPALMPQGEVALSIEDPMAVRYNPEATDAEDAYEMFVGKLWVKGRALKHFGLTPEDLDTSGDEEDRKQYADLMSSAAGGAGWLSSNSSMFGSNLGSSQDEALGDRVLVLEYYHDRDDEAPEGRHWISIGRKVVWPRPGDKDYPNGEAPLPNGFWPPLIPVLALPIPGQPQALSTLAQVVPINEALNTLDGKIAEHEIMMAMGGKWFIHPEDKGLVISTDPAQVIASKGYALGKPPIQSDLKTLPAEIYAERSVLMDKIRLVASLSEAELGQKPEGVSAGRAFLVLQEVTDSATGPDLQAWEEALEEVGRRELILARKYYREDRTIAIRGDHGQWEIRSFKGADLSDGLDVRVQVGSSFPWSKSAQWDTKLSVLTNFKELVMKPDGTLDQERFAKFLDTAGTGLQSFESDEDPDLTEVDREHAMFEAYGSGPGEQQLPQLAFWQSHPKHLDAHYRFMKRSYARYERWSDEAKVAFTEHMRLTAEAVDQIATTLAAAAQPPQPGMPPSGPPSAAAPGGDAETSADPSAGAGGAPRAAPPPADPSTPSDQNPNDQPALSPADFASAGPGAAPSPAPAT